MAARTLAAENLLRNPGFEQGDQGWSIAGHWWYESPKGSGLSAFRVDDSVAHTGRRSLRLTGADNRGVGLQRVNGSAGVEYRASAWIKTQGLGPVEAGFDVGLLGDEGQWLTGVAPRGLTGDNDWTLLSITFTPPAGTKYLQIHVFTRGQNRGVVWYDDVSMEPVLPPPPVESLRLKPVGMADALLDWSAYPRREDVRSFRVYQSPNPFTEVGEAKLVAEVGPDVTTYTATGGREAFFAVTAVGEKGREVARVVSFSALAAQPSQPVPPKCLWADNLSSGQGIFLAGHVEAGPGGAHLAWRRTREWFTVADAKHVRADGGWAGPRCDKPGGALTITFSGSKLLAYAPGSPDLGIVEVSLDGGKPRDMDLFHDWTPTRQVVLADCSAGGQHTVLVRLSGRKSEKAAGLAAQFDLFQVEAEGYAPEGFVVSEPIACAPGSDFRWGRLRYAAGRPAGTTLAVDVIDGAGKVLLADAQDGCDLVGVRAPILQLRARLATSDGGRSPTLAFWHVEYTRAPPSRADSGVALDGLTGRPVAGAKVTLRPTAAGGTPLTFTTDASGRFPAAKAGAGEYEVAASAGGYLDSRRRRVSLSPSAPLSAILYPAGALLGRRLQAWQVSAMDSIFEDSQPDRGPQPRLALTLEAAANEYEPAQLALRPTEDLGRLRVTATDLRGEGSQRAHTIPAANLRTYFVGYVPVAVNSPSVPEGELARAAPANFPDPLLTEDDRELTAGRTQPIWLSVKVPRDASPGRYTGALRLETAYGVVSVPVRLTVWPFALTDESHVWFGHGGSGWSQVLSRYGTTGADDERWRIIKMALRNRAEHRENVMYLDGSVFDLSRVTRTAAGEYRYDFSELDRWIAAIRETYPHGRFLIEGACFAGRDGWEGKEIFFSGCTVYNEAGEADPAHSLPRISIDSEQFKTFARPFLAALEQHLAGIGMLDKFYTRMQDEPVDACREAYRRLAAFVHETGPRLKRFESIQTLGLADCLEIMNPQLDWFDRNRDYFLKNRRPGCMVWFYTCWMPRGLYPCRLTDYPLIKHRIIKWMSYRLGADGYDRWAWAWWDADPYDHASDLAPGDNHVVYPDPRRREIIGSLRWEMMRESVEDYEYLWTLGERLRQTAAALGAREGEFDTTQRPMELAARAVTSGADYERDPARLLALRREIAGEIAAAGASPRVVCQTAPAATEPVAPGAVAIAGITEKGAAVTVNGQAVKVGPDGRFRASAAVSAQHPRLAVRVSRGQASREFVLEFRIADAAEATMAQLLKRLEGSQLDVVPARAALEAYRRTVDDSGAKATAVQAARDALLKAAGDLQRAEISALAAGLLAIKDPPGPIYRALKAEIEDLQARGRFDLARAVAARVGRLDARRFSGEERGVVVVPTVYGDRTGFVLKNDRLRAVLWDQGARIIDLRCDGVPLLNQWGLARAVSPGAWTDIGGYEDGGQGLYAENMTDWKLELRRDSEAEVSVACTRDLPGGVRLERVVSLREGETRLRLDYAVTNLGAVRINYVWRAHAEFGIGAAAAGQPGGNPAGDRFLVATADKLATEAFAPGGPGFQPGELRLTLNGNYAGAWDPAARAAVLHILPAEARQVTVWIGADLYTVEPWTFRALEPGETYRFTTYLAAAAPVGSAEEAARAALP